MARDWMKEADVEAGIGLSTFIGLAIRLDNPQPADNVLSYLVENGDDAALLRLARDEVRLSKALDKDGHNLVVHEVAKVLAPGLPETEKFLTNSELLLSAQDADLNSSLHYLADAGVDLLGAVPFKCLLIRNRNGATPLHLLAKHARFSTRLSALPPSVLHLSTRNGATISGILNSSQKPEPTILQELGTK